MIKQGYIRMPSISNSIKQSIGWWFPGFMVLIGFGNLLYDATGSFVFISIAGGIAAAYCLVYVLAMFCSRNINIIRLAACQSVIGYFVPLTYYLLLDRSGLLKVTQADLANATILIAISLTIGWVFSFVLDIKVRFPLTDTPYLRPRDYILILIPFCIIQVALIATGNWSYELTHAANTDPAGLKLGPLALLMASVTPCFGPLVAYNYGLLPAPQRTWGQRVMLVLILVIEAAFTLIASRVIFMLDASLTATVFALGRFKHRVSSKQILQASLALLIMGFVFVQANKLFITMRLAGYAHGTHSASITDFIEQMKRVEQAEAADELEKNVRARPFIIESVGVFQKYAHGHLYGKGVLYEFLRLVPAAVWKKKEEFLAEFDSPEALWDKDLGVPYLDYANSLVLDGFSDFSYPGFLIITTLCAGMLVVVRRIILLAGNTTLAYMCTFGFLAKFLSPETAIEAFIILARNFLILLCIMSVFYAMWDLIESLTPPPRKRLKARRTGNLPTEQPAVGG